jgi:hypothetical protein
MASADSQANMTWTILIIVLSSCIVFMGTSDLNRHYRSHYSQISSVSMQRLLFALHGANNEWQTLKR